MKSAKLEPIRLDLQVRDLAREPISSDLVTSMVRSFAVAGVRCAKHGASVREIDVQMKPGRAAVSVTPCCVRAGKELEAHLRKLKAVWDDRVPDVAGAGQRSVRPHDPPPTIAASPPMPFVPFATSGTGQRAVSKDVARSYAQAGRLQHIAHLNGEKVDVYSSETAEDEMLATSVADGKVPPCTAENIRIRTKKLIAEAAKLALEERRPLSDYASYVDWDRQVMHVEPAAKTRKMFVEAGDVPNLVEELDANTGETLLVFIFANNRYDRTMRITARCFVAGKAGDA